MLVRKESKTNLSSFMYRTIFPRLIFYLYTIQEGERWRWWRRQRKRKMWKAVSGSRLCSHLLLCRGALRTSTHLPHSCPVFKIPLRTSLLQVLLVPPGWSHCLLADHGPLVWNDSYCVSIPSILLSQGQKTPLPSTPGEPSRKRLYPLPRGEPGRVLAWGGHVPSGWWCDLSTYNFCVQCFPHVNESDNPTPTPPAPKVCVVIACILRKRIHKEVKTCVAQVAELGFEPSCLAGALKLYAP